MKSTITSCLILLSAVFVFSQSNQNISLLSNVKYEVSLSDIWGYTAPDGTEYALVGLVDGTSIMNLSNPTSPVEISRIQGGISAWKDIKTYNNRAYIVGEYEEGLQIIDLSTLPDTIPATNHQFFDENIPSIGKIGACHNIYIEEKTGVAYLSGCSQVTGGVIMLDISQEQPSYLGRTNNPYSHDVYVRNDTMYSSDIFDGFFSIIDVTNKSNPITLTTQRTPSQFTHNTWLSDNGKTLFTTDEVQDAAVAAYDISDLDNIKLADRFFPEGSRGTQLIPHNVHVKNDFLITSYYTEGVVITDATRPGLLIQTGNYDTYVGPNGDFSGAWGAFPFFESDIILVSDVENGLFVLQPTYQRAVFFEGIVRDSVTEEVLSNAIVTVVYRGNTLVETRTNLSGFFEIGTLQTGPVEIIIEKQDYKPVSFELNFESGKNTAVDIELFPNFLSIAADNVGGCAPQEVQFSAGGIPISNYQWSFEGGTPATSTDPTPIITFDNPGAYSVQLSSNFEDELFETQRTNLIKITGVPTPLFSFERDRRMFTFQDLSQESDSLFWDFGDGSTSIEENPTHQFAVGLLPIVTLTATNECGSSSFSIDLGDNTTSLEELNLLKDFRVVPNPITPYAAVYFDLSPTIKEVYFELTDITGRVIHRLPIDPTTNQVLLGSLHLNAGIYFGQLVTPYEDSEVIKLVAL